MVPSHVQTHNGTYVMGHTVGLAHSLWYHATQQSNILTLIEHKNHIAPWHALLDQTQTLYDVNTLRENSRSDIIPKWGKIGL